MIKKTTINPTIFLLAFVALACIFIYGTTYMPAVFDEHAAGGGQVITMVNPNGADVARDAAYSDVNVTNAQANVLNAKAYDIQNIPWIIYVFGFSFLGILLLVIKRAWS